MVLILTENSKFKQNIIKINKITEILKILCVSFSLSNIKKMNYKHEIYYIKQ